MHIVRMITYFSTLAPQQLYVIELSMWMIGPIEMSVWNHILSCLLGSDISVHQICSVFENYRTF